MTLFQSIPPIEQNLIWNPQNIWKHLEINFMRRFIYCGLVRLNRHLTILPVFFFSQIISYHDITYRYYIYLLLQSFLLTVSCWLLCTLPIRKGHWILMNFNHFLENVPSESVPIMLVVKFILIGILLPYHLYNLDK